LLGPLLPFKKEVISILKVVILKSFKIFFHFLLCFVFHPSSFLLVIFFLLLLFFQGRMWSSSFCLMNLIIPKFFGIYLRALLTAFVSAFDVLPHIMANSNIVLIDGT